MQLIDALFRQGHLSEQSLVEALLTGDRPTHLDRCATCAERAIEMGRWLDAIQAVAAEAADAAFPPERLAQQQTQILRRLEQLDQPSRVIAFPSLYRIEPPDRQARRVSPAWIGVAAAAGLVLGVIGGQITARLDVPNADLALRAGNPAQTAPSDPAGPSLLDFDLEQTMLRGTPVGTLDEMTPTLVSARVGR